MGDKSVNVLLYSGGKMTIGKQGPTYDRPHRRAIRLRRGTTYAQLLDKIYSAMGINRTSCTLKMTFRCPQYLGQNSVTYVGIEIVDDDTVDIMLDFPFDHPSVTLVELYLEIEDLISGGDSTQTNLSLPDSYTSPHTTQCTLQYNHPSPIHQFSGPINQACHISLLHAASPQQMFHNHEFGGTSNRGSEFSSLHAVGHVSNVSDSQPVPGPGEDRTKDDMDAYGEPNHVSDNDNESEEGDKTNQNDRTPSNNDLCKGLTFKTKEEVQFAVKRFSIHNNSEYIVAESTTKVWAVRCLLHDKCKWRLRASLRKKHGQFQITKYVGPHSCKHAQLKSSHKQLDSKFISSRIKSLVEVDPTIKIAGIIACVQDEFGYKISYAKAWSAKQKAIENISGNCKGTIVDIQSLPSA